MIWNVQKKWGRIGMTQLRCGFVVSLNLNVEGWAVGTFISGASWSEFWMVQDAGKSWRNWHELARVSEFCSFRICCVYLALCTCAGFRQVRMLRWATGVSCAAYSLSVMKLQYTMWCSAPKAFSRKKEAEQDAAKQALHPCFRREMACRWILDDPPRGVAVLLSDSSCFSFADGNSPKLPIMQSHFRRTLWSGAKYGKLVISLYIIVLSIIIHQITLAWRWTNFFWLLFVLVQRSYG